MLTYLHDIRNKLTLISGQTMILSKKYGEEDFLPIRANLVRISELINDAYRHLKEDKEDKKTSYTPSEFVRQMDLLTDTMSLLFPLDIKNETRDYHPGAHVYNVEFNIGQIFQVIENAIDNSVKAHAKKIIVRILEVKDHCIYEIVDNGTGKPTPQAFSVDFAIEGQSIIPHGIGKEIMIQNMQAIGGKIEWTRRLDYSGMIVRLYFPKKGQSAILS